MPISSIFLVVSSMHAGGAERVAANLVNAWSAKGIHVTLLVTYSQRGDCFYPLSTTVDLRYLADEAGIYRSRLLGYPARFLTLRRLIRTTRPNVVVSFLTDVNIATVLATLGLKIPTIVCERTYPPLFQIGSLWSLLRRWTYPLASCVTMLTSEGLDWLRKEIPSARGVIMPNPVPYPLAANDPELSPDTLLRRKRKLVLAAGRLSEEKGFTNLITAFASLATKHRQWDLVILGEGPLRPKLTQQVVDAGLSDRVLMPGRAGNVGDWYKRADLYVLSSRVEGFPNTLGEAMAHGCAAVSFDCDTGPRDLIRHEIDGLLVRPGDLGALGQSLARLMQDDALRAQMGAKALDVRHRYSMEQILSMWEKLFTEVRTEKRFF
jgi:glycosyltransferase involved in cell wall biosynthesis